MSREPETGDETNGRENYANAADCWCCSNAHPDDEIFAEEFPDDGELCEMCDNWECLEQTEQPVPMIVGGAV